MIRINKGNAPPNLTAKNAEMLETMKVDFEEHRDDYLNGVRKFEFTGDYRTEEVRNALIACQNNKCCFSEAKFVGDYSDIEHFRPKGRVDPYPNGDSQYPGYYWLAYDWTNLFLCKSRINSTNKRNFFPLENDLNRNRTHHDTNKENPILIDCSLEDPRKHIKFANDEPIGIDERGKINIEFFKLRHPDFTEARLKRFIFLKAIKDLVEENIANGKSKDEYAVPIGLLREAMQPTEEFSSMAIDFLSGWPHFE